MPQTDHAKEWENAKEHFEAVTDGKKPSPGVLKHRTGLSKKLKTLDGLFDETTEKIDIKKYEKEISTFSKAADEYIQVLDVEIQKERDKNAEKTRKRALKALKTRLESYKALYTLNLEDKKSGKEGVDALETLQRRLGKALKLGVASCAASLKVIKSDPTPIAYNKEMVKGARSLTTALKGFRQIRDMKQKLAGKLGEEYKQTDVSKFWLEKANSYVDDLTPYADGRGPGGDKTKVPNTANGTSIMAEVKTVSTILKGVAADFRALL